MLEKSMDETELIKEMFTKVAKSKKQVDYMKKYKYKDEFNLNEVTTVQPLSRKATESSAKCKEIGGTIESMYQEYQGITTYMQKDIEIKRAALSKTTVTRKK